MENEYSKLYNYFYNKTEYKAEQLLKNLFLFHKNKNKAFSYFSNPTLLKIEEKSREMFYINSSKKFNSVIEIFKSSEFDNLVFQEEMFEAFKTIEDIGDNYNYKKFISELGQIKALKEVGRKFRKFDVIYKFMYQLNDFSEFKLWDYVVDVETHPIFKKFHKKIYPNSYISDDISKNIKFKIKKEYKTKFEEIYDDLTISFINEKLTSKEDFKNIFLLNDNNHNSEIHFFCETEKAAFLLRELEFAFVGLNFTNIKNSEVFLSKNNKKLGQKNLSNSLKAFKKKQDEYEFLELKSEVVNILSKIK